MAEAAESPTTTQHTRGLRGGSLSIWEAVGISIALMAPSMAANINPQGTVGLVGRAVPLAFVFATVGVLLVSYTFLATRVGSGLARHEGLVDSSAGE
jgi:hypothetical protein